MSTIKVITMISTEEIERLMQLSFTDPLKEPAFFRALLTATVFVHSPANEPADRRQFVLFKSPDDGQYVVPVFTSSSKATAAGGPAVKIVAMSGRELMTLTRGTGLMLNPNDTRCTLYPEELERLLRDGTIPALQKHQLEESGDTAIIKPTDVPRSLIVSLKQSLPNIPMVEVAYVAGVRLPAGAPTGLLVALGCSASEGERSVRAVATALETTAAALTPPIDITYFACGVERPSWIGELNLKPVYKRRGSGMARPTSRLN